MAGQRGDTFNNEGNRGWQFAGPNYGNVFFLGSNHVIGHDDVKGIRAAAEGGNANAQFKLGLMYRKGRNVHQSDDDAVIWYTKAAGQRHPLALNNLGLMYRDGKGVEQSDEEAVILFRKALERGSIGALESLGWMYEHGRGVPQSDKEAVEWYRRSAEQGRAAGQYSLGRMYENGRGGVPQSDEDAVRWYRCSASQGNADAKRSLDMMTSIWWPFLRWFPNSSFVSLGFFFPIGGIMSVFLYKFLNE